MATARCWIAQQNQRASLPWRPAICGADHCVAPTVPTMPDMRPLVIRSTRPRPARAASKASRRLAALALPAAVGAMLVLPGQAAHGAEPAECKTLVLSSTADRIDVDRVTKAAEKVQDQAADVRIRVY